MHLSHLKPFVAQPFASAAYARNLSGHAIPRETDRVPPVSERDGNSSRGSRNQRQRQDGAGASSGNSTSLAQGLFSQLVSLELGAADEVASSATDRALWTAAPKAAGTEPSIYDLLALVAPPLT